MSFVNSGYSELVSESKSELLVKVKLELGALSGQESRLFLEEKGGDSELRKLVDGGGDFPQSSIDEKPLADSGCRKWPLFLKFRRRLCGSFLWRLL